MGWFRVVAWSLLPPAAAEERELGRSPKLQVKG